MKHPSTYHEISIELPPLMVKRLKESCLGKRTLAEEAIRMMRYALRQMFPPQTPDEWKNVVGKADWKELLHALPFKGRGNINQDSPIDRPYKMVLQVPSDMMAKIEEIAQFKRITVSEAAVYTIEYALTKIFPPKTPEELNKELRETWRGIFRALWNRSQSG